MNTPGPLIGFGQVRHTRLRPRHHAFSYGSWFWLLPMRALAKQPVEAVRRNARGWLSFHDADHGAGGADALAWLDGLLRQAGLWDDALAEGDTNGGIWSAGMVQGLIHDIPTVKDLVDRMVAEAEAIIRGRLAGMVG